MLVTSAEDLRATFRTILQSGGGEEAADQFLVGQMRYNLKANVLQKWTQSIEKLSAQSNLLDPIDLISGFDSALNIVGESFEHYRAMCSEKQSVLDCLLRQIRVVIVPSFSASLIRLLESVLRLAFRACSAVKNNESCVCNQESQCRCVEIVRAFRICMEKLSLLKLTDILTFDIAKRTTFDAMNEKVQSVYGSTLDFTSRHLCDIQKWVNESLISWLLNDMGFDESTASKEKSRLESAVYESVGRCLISHLFQIIVEYPETAPSLTDLSTCLDHTQLRTHLTESLKKDMANRLLFIGVSTSDVLEGYIAAIRSLQVLDSSGIIMSAVCQPIREYLRSRADTVRCIVAFLTDQRQQDLRSELEKPRFGMVFDEYGEEDSAAADIHEYDDLTETSFAGTAEIDEDWTVWMPDPIDAPIEQSGRSRKSADLISMLVGVYGSKDLFVKEYRQLLSERLIKSLDKDVDTELRYLQLLKIRFGENELQQCEVMLKDIKDSDRVDMAASKHSLQQTDGNKSPLEQLPFPVSARIISCHFWPKLREERVKLPKEMQQGLDAYNRHYGLMKASRSLHWLSGVGSVEMDLSIGEAKSVPLKVGLIQAAILWLFQEKDTWTVDELTSALNARSSAIRRRLRWWQSLGLIQEKTANQDEWTLTLANESGGGPSVGASAEQRMLIMTNSNSNDNYLLGSSSCDSDEGEMDAVSQEAELDHLEQYWEYIGRQVLTSLDSVKAERVHSLLRMFTSPGQQGPSLDTVTAFLQRKVKQGLLTFGAGVYKAPAKR